MIAGATFALTQEDVEDPPSAAHRRPTTRWLRASCNLDDAILGRIQRGTFPGRSPDVQYVPRRPHFFGSFDVTTHSGPWGYLQRVPLMFYGPGYIRPAGDVDVDRPVTVADIAPTMAELLGTTLPGERPGRVIEEILVPAEQRIAPPRLMIVVVWDGGGWNVLDRWPKAWPTLRSMMRAGASVQDATVGSSPSVTPAIHTTMGTGTFPNEHGVVDIPIRRGRRVTDAFPNKSAKFLEVPTLADMYDLDMGNAPLVGLVAERGWHLGMMGAGALHEGGDRDFAVMSQGGEGELTTNTNYYRLPRYLRDVPGFAKDSETVDLSDGRNDDLWMGHTLPEIHRAGAANPVWTLYQVRLIKALFDKEGFGDDEIPDLFFTNFKEIDLIGHVYNMVNPEMRSVLEHSDASLARLEALLDEAAGRGRWVMAMTADHGVGPDPRSIGAWPIDMKRLQIDLALHFGSRVTELFQAQRPTGMWFRPDALADADIDLEDVAEFLLDYRIEDNIEDNQDVPAGYRRRLDERLFRAAFPTTRLDEVLSCSEAAA